MHCYALWRIANLFFTHVLETEYVIALNIIYYSLCTFTVNAYLIIYQQFAEM